MRIQEDSIRCMPGRHGRCSSRRCMTAIRPHVDHCVDVVHHEYVDLPGLHLTKAQMRRFLGVDAETCDAVLRHLEQEHFLRHTDADDWVLDRIFAVQSQRH